MSHVLSTGVASPLEASAFFEAQLTFRTDPADLAADLLAGEPGIVVIDTRSPAHYAEGHIPGAISFPHSTMSPTTTQGLSRDKVYVCYCDGIGCNGSTQGAYKLAALGYRRYEWKCNALNRPSWQAALRLGFCYEGTFRQARVDKGHSRDTAWFSVIDGEWPALKGCFERWLADDNFDGAGRQRLRLSELTATCRMTP